MLATRLVAPVCSLLVLASCAHDRPRQIPPAAAVDESLPVGAEAVAGESEGAAAGLGDWMWAASRKLTAAADANTRAWDRLAQMVDRFGHRLSGSRSLEQSIDWAAEVMAGDGLQAVRREKVMVPHWVRGAESLRVTAPVSRPLTILGLGMSVGTRRPVRAPIVVVDHVDAIAGLGEAAQGKVVLINQRMPPYDAEARETGYGETVGARVVGASAAAKVGAKAVLVRSVSAHGLDTPHTGTLVYADGVPQIPAAAVTAEGAELLARLASRGPTEVELRMGAKLLPDVASANVIGEIPGTEQPEEIVVLGAHIDSWDVGDGASDDGAGSLMVMEAAAMLHELGLEPKRTIRVVLFTNEENGLRGAEAYFAAHKQEHHVAAIEADSGAGAPWGFGIETDDAAALREVSSWAPLFADLGADHLGPGHSGSDISVLTATGVLGLGLRPDASHYFDIHHSRADTMDKIEPRAMQRNAAAIALVAYLLAQR